MRLHDRMHSRRAVSQSSSSRFARLMTVNARVRSRGNEKDGASCAPSSFRNIANAITARAITGMDADSRHCPDRFPIVDRRNDRSACSRRRRRRRRAPARPLPRRCHRHNTGRHNSLIGSIVARAAIIALRGDRAADHGAGNARGRRRDRNCRRRGDNAAAAKARAGTTAAGMEIATAGDEPAGASAAGGRRLYAEDRRNWPTASPAAKPAP